VHPGRGDDFLCPADEAQCVTIEPVLLTGALSFVYSSLMIGGFGRWKQPLPLDIPLDARRAHEPATGGHTENVEVPVQSPSFSRNWLRSTV